MHGPFSQVTLREGSVAIVDGTRRENCDSGIPATTFRSDLARACIDKTPDFEMGLLMGFQRPTDRRDRSET